MKMYVFKELRNAVMQPNEGALESTQSQFPDVSFDTLISIFSQEWSRKIRMNHHRHKNPSKIMEYIQRYASGEDILEISDSVELPPCLLARLLLEHLVGISRHEVGAYLRDPSRIADELITVPLAPVRGVGGSPFKGGLASAMMIPGSKLRDDLRRCVESDYVQSPIIEAIKRSKGIEYEALLCEKLKALGVAFQSEDELRAAGFSKTPDAKLDVPIAVRGRVVNWIDSKASFGDEYMHRMQSIEQFQRYVNRFGPGMVIYWFGFIDELDDHAEVLLIDRFPLEEEVLLLPSLPVKARP